MEEQKLKYFYSKKVFIPSLILILLIFAYVINIEGWSVFLLSRDIICPNQLEMGVNKCSSLTLGNGSNVTLKIGETYHLNPHNRTNISILNWGTSLIAIIGFIINDRLYNKKYPLKQKLKNMKETIEKNWKEMNK